VSPMHEIGYNLDNRPGVWCEKERVGSIKSMSYRAVRAG